MEQVPPNPIVFLDVSVGGRSIGRIQIELFADQVPRTAENFRQLCTGEFHRDGIPKGYKGASFHRLIPGFMIQGGDFVRGDGTGTVSIYGDSFADEPVSPGTRTSRHSVPGMVAMANTGHPHTNGCQFYITLAPCEHLDGKHVIVGQVIKGMEIVRLLERVPTVVGSQRPRVPIIISECGEM